VTVPPRAPQPTSAGFGRDRVDVVGREQARHPHAALASPFEQGQQQVPGALLATLVDGRVERLEPLPGLFGVDVVELAERAAHGGVEGVDHVVVLRLLGTVR
jgi:hypothetical protein